MTHLLILSYYIQQEQARAGARTVQMGGQSPGGRKLLPAGDLPLLDVLLDVTVDLLIERRF